MLILRKFSDLRKKALPEKCTTHKMGFVCFFSDPVALARWLGLFTRQLGNFPTSLPGAGLEPAISRL
jgi:hypothetical protein